MIFDCDVVEMSVKSAMGQTVETKRKEENPYYATLNLHSDRAGKFEKVIFSDEIEQYIIRKNIYKNPGDDVSVFTNASDALGIVFFHFSDGRTMLEMEDKMNEHVRIMLQGDL